LTLQAIFVLFLNLHVFNADSARFSFCSLETLESYFSVLRVSVIEKRTNETSVIDFT